MILKVILRIVPDKVQEGDIITIEKLGVEDGEKVTFDQVLVIGGDSLKVGTPTVDGALVEPSVEYLLHSSDN